MSNENFKDLPCLACNARGCLDIIEAGQYDVTFICTDCEGTGYIDAAQAEAQRAALNGSI